MPSVSEQVKTHIETEDAFESVTADDNGGIIRGVKLLGIRSKNRRNYDTPGVRKTGVSMLEGVQGYIDHLATAQTPRSYRDKIGVVENVKYRSGEGHFGDIRYNPKHPSADQFLWDVKNAPKSLGMSINAKYKPGKTDNDGNPVVESLELVRSVDIVTKPATADGIFEHEVPDEDEEMTLDIKTLKEKHGDLVEQLLAEHAKTVDESSEIETLRKQAKEALEQLEAIKAEAAKKAIRDAVESQVAKLFENTSVSAEIIKDVVECACQMPEDNRKSMLGVVEKLGPMLVNVPDSEDDDLSPEDGDEQEHEDKKPAYRPAASKSGRKIDFRKDILGIS
jgi:hypothetical protein